MICPNLLNSSQPGGRRSTSVVVTFAGSFFGVDAAAPDDVVAASVVSGVDLFSSSGSQSSNMNSISSETLSSMTWGLMKTMCGRMSRK